MTAPVKHTRWWYAADAGHELGRWPVVIQHVVDGVPALHRDVTNQGMPSDHYAEIDYYKTNDGDSWLAARLVDAGVLVWTDLPTRPKPSFEPDRWVALASGVTWEHAHRVATAVLLEAHATAR